MMASVRGVVRRPLPIERCDVVIVGRGGERVRTCLDFEHTVTESGSVLILDAEGKPFDDDGEFVGLAGGDAEAPAWPGERMFVVGQVRRDLPPATPLTAPLWGELFGHLLRGPGTPKVAERQQ